MHLRLREGQRTSQGHTAGWKRRALWLPGEHHCIWHPETRCSSPCTCSLFHSNRLFLLPGRHPPCLSSTWIPHIRPAPAPVLLQASIAPNRPHSEATAGSPAASLWSTVRTLPAVKGTHCSPDIPGNLDSRPQHVLLGARMSFPLLSVNSVVPGSQHRSHLRWEAFRDLLGVSIRLVLPLLWHVTTLHCEYGSVRLPRPTARFF